MAQRRHTELVKQLIGGVGLIVMLAVTACAPSREVQLGNSSMSAQVPVNAVLSGWPKGAAVDYQLGGAYPPDPGVGIVARDSSAQSADGLYSICYVNGFQTQPADHWPDALVLHDASGSDVVDNGWPDERILDISTAEKRSAIAKVLAPTVHACAVRGFQAVEFDNLDSYTRSNGAFNLLAAEAMARLLVELAHREKLAAGQKNTPDLGERGRTGIGFDFAVAEQCRRFDECLAYTRVYGDYVIDIEYTDDLGATVPQVCADPQLPRSSVIRDRMLSAPGSADYQLRRCR